MLDKNYSKEDITTKDGLLNDPDKVDIDYVIKKASGEYSSGEKIERKKKVKEVKEEEKVDDLIELFKETDEEIKEIELDNKKENNEKVDEKIKSIDELLNDTSDEDFYSLVDNMYKEGVDD